MPKRRQIPSELVTFGANLRRERVARGFTQEKLAEVVEVNPRTIQKIEAGHINILLTTVLRIQKALRCKWNDLMRGLTSI